MYSVSSTFVSVCFCVINFVSKIYLRIFAKNLLQTLLETWCRSHLRWVGRNSINFATLYEPFFNAVVTYKVKLFQNHFSPCRHPRETILFQRLETCLKLFQNYFRGLLQLVNICQQVRCRRNNNFKIISKLFQRLK